MGGIGRMKKFTNDNIWFLPNSAIQYFYDHEQTASIDGMLSVDGFILFDTTKLDIAYESYYRKEYQND